MQKPSVKFKSKCSFIVNFLILIFDSYYLLFKPKFININNVQVYLKKIFKINDN